MTPQREYQHQVDWNSASDLHFQRVSQAIEQGRDFLFSIQKNGSFWCGELESNPSITAEYVFLNQILNIHSTLKEKRDSLIEYFRNRQNSDGSWSIARFWDGDLSTTAEVYLALRILQVPQEHPDLKHAESFIRNQGGLEKIRIFTRIFFAMFGLVPWSAVPAIPPELILIPNRFPLNIYSLSSWARGTMIPLFIIFHHRPVFSLPNGCSRENVWLDHLWIHPSKKEVRYSATWQKRILAVFDAALKTYERFRISYFRNLALEKCTEWILEHQELSGDWAGIFPPMLNSVFALSLQGYSLTSEPIQKGIQAIERFAWEDEDGLRIQPCVSPVWDTVLAMIGLIDSGTHPHNPKLLKSRRWVLDKQLLVSYGDWKVLRPDLPAGGWAFEYENSWYPDIDDTAAVILALLKQDPSSIQSDAIQRALAWLLGMQNEDGGWAAFDVDNNHLFLNDLPFSDMDSLCDPSSPDVTGRVIEALGLALSYFDPTRNPGGLEASSVRAVLARGLEYLRRTQEGQGSWFGRWGVNYIYGTSNVLCGLSRIDISGSDPMIQRSLEWLKLVQNPDGGWGESLASYSDSKWMGRGISTPSQTAWALIGLLSFMSPKDLSIRKGVEWLIRNPWEEEQFTGTGFPKHFYLRYHLYPRYFPMMALGRYLKKAQQEQPKKENP